VLAETILRNYTRQVYLATKNHGWDGRLSHLQYTPETRPPPPPPSHLSHLYDVIDEEQVVVTSQWDMAGSLLFAITVITTIGAHTSQICMNDERTDEKSLSRWLRGTVVERRSLAGELMLFCARPAADG